MVSRVGLPNYRWLLLLASVAAASCWPQLASADPSNVQLDTTGFTVWNNQATVTFEDTRVGSYTCDRSRSGLYINGDRLGECSDRSVTTSGLHFGNGGQKRVGVQIRYERVSRDVGTGETTFLSYARTPIVYSGYQTFPVRPNITSASITDTSLFLDWTSPTHSGSTLDWWVFVSASSSPSNYSLAIKAVSDDPSARSATVDLATLTLTPGEPLFVWVALKSSTPSTSQSSYLYWSSAYRIDSEVLEVCADGHVSELGYFTGYDQSIAGSFQDAPCSLNSVAAHVYSFKLSAQRDVSFTFTPHTDFQSGQGTYGISVRTASLSGSILGEASDLGTVVVENLAIAADISYYIFITRSGAGGGYGWTLAFSYGFIPPPTPTPAPTPTPRLQPNLDFRLHPNPGGISYTAGTTYSFEFQGPAHIFPVTVQSSNPAALELGTNSNLTCDVVAEDEVTVSNQSSVLYAKACTAGRNTTLSLLGSQGQILDGYSIFVRGDAVSRPDLAMVPPGGDTDVSKRDVLGLGLVLGFVCGGFGVGCDMQLITNALVTIAAVGVMGFLLRRSRGAATSMSVGVAAAFGVSVLMLGYLWVGFDLWLVVIVLLPILALGGLAGLNKVRQAG